MLMQLKEQERRAIIEEASRAGIRAVYVFGSVLQEEGEPHDIDVAVDGVPRGALFRFYASLARRLSKPLDVVDLRQKNEVTDLIARSAVRLQ